MTFSELNESFNLLVNGSLVEAVNVSYAVSFGVWFWPIIFIVTLGLVSLKTQNVAAVVLYAIIGNVTLVLLLPVETTVLFYIVLTLSIALTLYMLFGSPQTD